MGMAKRAWEEALFRGWESDGGSICPSCAHEPSLRLVVAGAVDSDRNCDFCGRTPAADFDVLLDATMAGFKNEFSRIDDEYIPL